MILDRFLFLFQATEFNMKDAIYALVFTVIILGGLLIVEAIHKPKPRRSRRPDRRAQELIPPVVSPTEAEPFETSTTETATAPTSFSTSSAPTYEASPSRFTGVRWLWAIFAGFASTLIMSVVYTGIGWNTSPDTPKLDPASDLAMFLSNQTGSEIVITVGWLIHLMMGIVLGLMFALFVSNRFTNRPLFFRGLVYGFAIWVVLQAIVMPVMGAGFFASNMEDGQGAVLTVSLIGHIVFGIVLSWIYRGPRDDE